MPSLGVSSLDLGRLPTAAALFYFPFSADRHSSRSCHYFFVRCHAGFTRKPRLGIFKNRNIQEPEYSRTGIFKSWNIQALQFSRSGISRFRVPSSATARELFLDLFGGGLERPEITERHGSQRLGQRSEIRGDLRESGSAFAQAFVHVDRTVEFELDGMQSGRRVAVMLGDETAG